MAALRPDRLPAHPGPADATPAELLFEAAGRELDTQSPNIAAVLLWLRAVRVRLLAEAARQNRFSARSARPASGRTRMFSPPCKPRLRRRTSALCPCAGAWFAGSKFSASIHAFVDERDAGDNLIARAWLEDDDGERLAALKRPCPSRGGEIGLLTCILPSEACV